MIQAARFYHVPPWEYAALLFDLPVSAFTAYMVLWTDWAAILSSAEAQVQAGPQIVGSESF